MALPNIKKHIIDSAAFINRFDFNSLAITGLHWGRLGDSGFPKNWLPIYGVDTSTGQILGAAAFNPTTHDVITLFEI